MLGIIGAMQVEVDALKGLMTDQQVRTISNMEYVAGKLDGRPVVAVVCGEGQSGRRHLRPDADPGI